MTTTQTDPREDHIRYPSIEDVYRHAARAKKQGLNAFGYTTASEDGESLIHTRFMPASSEGEGTFIDRMSGLPHYTITVRENISKGTVLLSCTCPAGQWGRCCKHMGHSVESAMLPDGYVFEVALLKKGDDDE